MMIAKQRADWERFSLLVASVKNILVTNEKSLIKPDDLNPYFRKKSKKQQELQKEKIVKIDKKTTVNIFEKRYGKCGKN